MIIENHYIIILLKIIYIFLLIWLKILLTYFIELLKISKISKKTPAYIVNISNHLICSQYKLEFNRKLSTFILIIYEQVHTFSYELGKVHIPLALSYVFLLNTLYSYQNYTEGILYDSVSLPCLAQLLRV